MWEFEKDGRELNARVDGQLVVNDIALALEGAVRGTGITYLPKDYVQADVEAGRLERVLGDGVRLSLVTTSTFRAAGNSHQFSPSLSRGFDIEVER